MADSSEEPPREQHNHGSGPFIGRDNYGPISYEMLDQNTRDMLEKLSRDAPDLAKLLKTALHDGMISPEVADALMLAAHNINEDVADALMLAGRNINEDVAESLWQASRNINEDVANSMLRAAGTLSETMDRLDRFSFSLNRTVENVNGGSGLSRLIRLESTLTGAAERIERVFTPPPPEIIVDRRGKFNSFLLGAVIGALTVIALVIFHVKPF